MKISNGSLLLAIDTFHAQRYKITAVASHIVNTNGKTSKLLELGRKMKPSTMHSRYDELTPLWV